MTMMTTTLNDHYSLLESALTYYDKGWCVIPIKHRDASGKQPACSSWREYKSVRPERSQITTWFQQKDLDGLAVICGPVSGSLTCRDFDIVASYEIWSSENPKLARDLPTVATARGYHVYFRSDVNRIIVCSDGEVRGNGYCLLPPSRHPDGSVYRWLDDYDLNAIPIIDPFTAELAPRETERTEQTERTERTETTESTEDNRGNNNCSVLSVLSVSPDIEAKIRGIIKRTLPTRVGERNKAIFAFARELKALSALVDAPVACLKLYVRQWHDQALPVIGTKPFEDTWFDFAHGWERVKFPAGSGPLATVVQRAGSKPPPSVAFQYEAPETRRLVAICRELQLAAGNGPFYLSSRTAANLLGIDHVTVWRRLSVFCVDGILKVVEPGTQLKAARYRYLPSE